jgi:hypothetical protein
MLLNFYCLFEVSLTSDSNDPVTVGRDASKHIGEALGASDAPRNGTNNIASCHQWATRITHAHALTSLTESTDRVVEHTGGIDDRVTGTAILVGQNGGVEPLQVVGNAARVL